MPKFLQRYLHHHWRFYLCLILGIAVYAFTGMLDPRVRVLAAGDAFFAAYLLIMMVVAYRITPKELDRKADIEDEGILLVIALSVVVIGFCCYAAGIATTLLIHEPNGRALDDISHDLAA